MPKPYESEFTVFMRDWLESHPEQREVQRTGRALWWDRRQDAEAQRGYEAARVPVRACCYDIGS